MKIGSNLPKVIHADLKGILKLDKIVDKSVKEVVDIWNTFHGSLSQSVSIAMNLKKHDLFIDRLSENKLFMQPIIRNPEFFFLYSLMKDGCKFVTFHPMAGNIDDPEIIDPSFILRIFNELTESHGIYLIRGDVVDGSINKTEADIVMRALIAHYVETDLYEEYVIPFNNDLANFNHTKFLHDYFQRFGKKVEEQ